MSQLAIIAQRMSKKHVYIKNLDVVDELGAATVIATDKVIFFNSQVYPRF